MIFLKNYSNMFKKRLKLFWFLSEISICVIFYKIKGSF